MIIIKGDYIIDDKQSCLSLPSLGSMPVLFDHKHILDKNHMSQCLNIHAKGVSVSLSHACAFRNTLIQQSKIIFIQT